MVIPPLFTASNPAGAVTAINAAGSSTATEGSFFKAFADAQASAATQQSSLALGSTTNDVASVMVGSAQADLGAESFALLVSRALSAYQEIMQMQV